MDQKDVVGKIRVDRVNDLLHNFHFVFLQMKKIKSCRAATPKNSHVEKQKNDKKRFFCPVLLPERFSDRSPCTFGTPWEILQSVLPQRFLAVPKGSAEYTHILAR